VTAPVLVIARLTLQEAASRKLIRVLVLLSIASVGLTAWGLSALLASARADGIPETAIQVVGAWPVLVITAFMFSFILAMTAGFLAAPAIAADIESGIAQAMLARPVRRADVVIGRWLGLAIVISGYAFLSGLLEIAVVTAIVGLGPPDPFLAVGYLAFEALLMLTLALLLSTRLTAVAAGAVTVVAFGLTWMAGVMGSVARALDADAVAAALDFSRALLPVDALWQGVRWSLQPPIAMILASGEFGTALDANPFYAAGPPSLPAVVGSVLWVTVALGLAIISFERREV
jgi:ABC-type transport system involved in multi-copper enzyme maturation permease subunit